MTKSQKFKQAALARKVYRIIWERECPNIYWRTSKVCTHCRGKGYPKGEIFLEDCPHCNGVGLIRKNGTKIEPNMA